MKEFSEGFSVEKMRSGNAAVFDAHGQPQFVAAYRIRGLNGIGRIGQFAKVARMRGMLEHGCAVHALSIPRSSASS